MSTEGMRFPGKLFIVAILDNGTKMSYEMAPDVQAEVTQEWRGEEPTWYNTAYQPIYGRTETRVSLEGRVVQGKIWKPGDDFIPTEQPSLETTRAVIEP